MFNLSLFDEVKISILIFENMAVCVIRIDDERSSESGAKSVIYFQFMEHGTY